MSFQNKRGALEQITKDDFERDDEYNRDEEVEVAKTADAATMQKRKVLPMPKRRTGGSSGAVAATGAAGVKPASNGFSGFSGLTGAGGSGGSGSGSSSVFSGLTGSASASPAMGSGTSSASDDSTLKRIAMNEKFVDTVSSKVRENSAVDLSDVVKKYLEYARQLGGSTNNSANVASTTIAATPTPASTTPASTASATPSDKPKSSLFSFGAAKNFTASPAANTEKDTSTPPTFGFAAKSSESKPFGFGNSGETKSVAPAASTASSGFSFGSKPETKESTSTTATTTTAPKPFNFGSAAPSGPSFSFGKSGADVAKEKAEGGAPSFSFTGKKPEEKPVEKKPAEKKAAPVEIDSDSDSDDEIDITKGPSFTLAAPPTTTNSAFTFNKPQSESSTKTTGPSFTFDKKVSTGGFSFKKEDKPEEKEEDKKEEEKKEDNKKDFTWNPSQGVVFGSSSEKKASEESSTKDDKPAFSFGAASSSSSSAPKPFTFGSKPAESGDDKPKPFTFGSKPADSASKPVFGGSAFGAKPVEGGAAAAPAFSFGQKPADSAASSTPAFGVSSGNLFKGNDAKTDTKASDDAGEPDDTPKTVTDSDDLSGQGPGEENEDNVAEYRVKLYKLDEGKWDVCGVGQLRVLVDKDTKKARLLMRAEQSGRVLLNCVVRKELTYSTTKSNVNIVDFDADSKPVKYMARIKTVPEAEQLSAKIEEVK